MISATATVDGSIGVTAQLMSVQTTVCAGVTEQVNGVPVGTTPSGGTNDQLNQDAAGNQVGTAANPSVVANSTAVNSDGSYSLSILAEGSNVISDTPILANGALFVNQPSTIAKDVVVRYANGTLVGSVVGSEVLIPNPVAAPTLTIDVFSDIALTVAIVAGNLGQTVYVKATPTGIAPTSYTFSFDGSTDLVVNQAGDVYTWVINSVGAVGITARATDGTGATANATGFSFTGNRAFIGGKAIKFDGVSDRAAGWCNIVRLWDTYGFGFVINDPTSADSGVIGIANFGMVNLTTGNWNARGGIDIWGRPDQTTFLLSTANTSVNVPITSTVKDARMFFYVQVTATLIEYYINGVLFSSVARANTAPLRDTRILLGYAIATASSRNCTIDTPLVTDGLLTGAEVTSLSAATLAQTDPTAVTSKVLECWDFGQLATGVPSTNVYAPTVAYGMLENSPITLTGTFASPDGIVTI